MPAPKKRKRTKASGRSLKWILRVFIKLACVCILFTLFQVATMRFINPPFTVAMVWHWLKGQFGLCPYEWPEYQWRSLKDMSPSLIRAVLAGEDQRFFLHNGFDFVELDNAVRHALTSGKTRGASTVTMQTARTVFLWPDRSLLRKSAEAYYTVIIELLWNKDRILEVYLNMVDWGEGLVGAEAAAKRYFHRRSDSLTARQAAALAAILPNPHQWSPTKPNLTVRNRTKRILRDMGHISLSPLGEAK